MCELKGFLVGSLASVLQCFCLFDQLNNDPSLRNNQVTLMVNSLFSCDGIQEILAAFVLSL